MTVKRSKIKLPEVLQRFNIYERIIKTETAINILESVCGKNIIPFVDKNHMYSHLSFVSEYISINTVFGVLHDYCDRKKTWIEKIKNFLFGDDNVMFNQLNKKLEKHITYPCEVAWNISRNLYAFLTSDKLYLSAYEDLCNYVIVNGYTVEEAIKMLCEDGDVQLLEYNHLVSLCLLFELIDPSIYHTGNDDFINFIIKRATEKKCVYNIYEDEFGKLYAYCTTPPANHFKLKLTIKPKDKL